jgi:predicted methyltransferase
LESNPHSKIILWQLKTTVPNYQDEGYIAKIKKKQNKWYKLLPIPANAPLLERNQSQLHNKQVIMLKISLLLVFG